MGNSKDTVTSRHAYINTVWSNMQVLAQTEVRQNLSIKRGKWIHPNLKLFSTDTCQWGTTGVSLGILTILQGKPHAQEWLTYTKGISLFVLALCIFLVSCLFGLVWCICGISFFFFVCLILKRERECKVGWRDWKDLREVKNMMKINESI